MRFCFYLLGAEVQAQVERRVRFCCCHAEDRRMRTERYGRGGDLKRQAGGKRERERERGESEGAGPGVPAGSRNREEEEEDGCVCAETAVQDVQRQAEDRVSPAEDR